MTDRQKYRPFTGDSDTSVRLSDAPLVLVLCQVRWPTLATLQTEDQLRALVPKFGAALEGYPLYSESKSINYVITPDGIIPSEAGSVHQWASVDDAWHISLSRQFMCVYATQYPGYDEFDSRLRAAVQNLKEVLAVPLVDRVGVRYVNQLSGIREVESLESFMDSSVLGFRALVLPFLQASTNQATYCVDGAVLQVRSGVLAPNQFVDPAIRPVPNESWVLDLDASQEARLLLDTEAVAQLASRMSDIAYDYFKAAAAEGLKNLLSKGDAGS